MIKLILTDNTPSGVLFETETMKVKSLDPTCDRIDRIYTAPCDLEVVFNDKKYLANKGDLIIKLYSIGNEKKELIVFRSDEYIEHVERFKKNIEESNDKSKQCSDSVCCNK